ncbi:MAG: carboxylesterase family protein [Segniliparus sp.]|uniref:carboxylesterase family protein n=1 Tax=Segniliparus sp. TaxID=2804064 RepID=UPI003F3F7DEF
MLSRRTALAGGLALGVGALAAHSGLRLAFRPETAAAPVVETVSGSIRGGRDGSVLSFLGVPYAGAPVGELRFRSPQPVRPWTGVRDAVAVGPQFLQFARSDNEQEDALTANVWTPAVEGRAPVLLYIHGGGWMAGSGGLPVYHGAQLAQRTGCVVATFNYRLGAFGFCAHPELTDPETGQDGNWGLADQMAALRWVVENIASFGGDPANITLAGTSAGGASTWQLAVHPRSAALVRRAVAISPAHIWGPYNSLRRDDGPRVFDAAAAEFGVTVPGLRSVPAPALRDWWDGAFRRPIGERVVQSGRRHRGSIAGDELFPAQDGEAPAPRIPMMVVHTSTEGSFFTEPDYILPVPPPQDEAELVERFDSTLREALPTVSAAEAADGLAAYRSAARNEGRPDDPLSLWSEIVGDAMVRHQTLRIAQRAAGEKAAPIWVMEYAHPVQAPWHGTPHEATSPFLFGTYRDWGLAEKYGAGEVERRVSETFMDLVGSFAKTSEPACAAAAHWPAFTAEDQRTLVVGGPDLARAGVPTKTDQLAFLDHLGWGSCAV